jgi:potassium-transporting ATPase KdpC subunit
MTATGILRTLRPALGVLLLLTFITGIVYPLGITLAAQLAFPDQANGSLVRVHGTVVGSRLIGQAFDDPRYLWGRPSAAGAGYDGMASAGSNLAPTSSALIERVTAELERQRAANGDAPVPVELVTASGSGLDPHISPAAAAYQASRIAAARGLPVADVLAAIERHTERPLGGLFGPAVVNVLLVNLDLDGALP